jgi:hypothetical protein
VKYRKLITVALKGGTKMMTALVYVGASRQVGLSFDSKPLFDAGRGRQEQHVGGQKGRAQRPPLLPL